MAFNNSLDKLNRIVTQTFRANDKRVKRNRARALKRYPWIFGRCSREFRRIYLQEPTTQHLDHDYNPIDGCN